MRIAFVMVLGIFLSSEAMAADYGTTFHVGVEQYTTSGDILLGTRRLQTKLPTLDFKMDDWYLQLQALDFVYHMFDESVWLQAQLYCTTNTYRISESVRGSIAPGGTATLGMLAIGDDAMEQMLLAAQFQMRVGIELTGSGIGAGLYVVPGIGGGFFETDETDPGLGVSGFLQMSVWFPEGSSSSSSTTSNSSNSEASSF